MSEIEQAEKLVGAQEVAEMLGYDKPSAVYRLVEECELPFYSMGRRAKRFKRSDVLAWVERRKSSYRVPDARAEPGPTVTPAPKPRAGKTDWGAYLGESGKA